VLCEKSMEMFTWNAVSLKVTKISSSGVVFSYLSASLLATLSIPHIIMLQLTMGLVFQLNDFIVSDCMT